MKLKPIITSLLSTDMYKINMQMVMFHKHPDATGKYMFLCRDKGVVFTPEMLEEINAQIDHLCTLTYTKEELDYLRTIRYLKKDFIEALRLFRLLRDYVQTSLDEDGTLHIEIEGPLWMASPFEIYLLEIVNEVYFRMQYNYDELLEQAKIKLDKKVEKFKDGTYNFKFAEFGARRRLGGEWQDHVVSELVKLPNCLCVGTSNIYLAKKYGVKPIGTYAHEYVQMFQGFDKISAVYSNYYAMEEWTDEFQGDNGTALTDTLTTKLFLKDLTYKTARCFPSFRIDSGDEITIGNMILARIEELRLDPKQVTLMFSNSLNCDKAQMLYDYFKDRCKVSFGIGTFFTNDTNVKALNIVIKLQFVNDKPVAKISDNPEKSMCQDEEYLKYLKSAVERRVNG